MGKSKYEGVVCLHCPAQAEVRGMCRKHYAIWYFEQPNSKAKKGSRLWQKSPKGKGRIKWHRRKLLTGWTEPMSIAARKEQDERCAICPRPLGDSFCHDHAHVTPPKPRGLLCRACNLSLGYYEKWQRPLGLVIEPYEVYLVLHSKNVRLA